MYTRTIHTSNFRFISTTIVVSLFFLVLPFLSNAAGIVPCGNNGTECTACHFVKLGQNLLDWFIKIMSGIIALVFAWAGIKMVMSAGNTEAVSSAKSMMTNSVVGLVIMLAAWLIINTLMVTLSVSVGNNGNWFEISCVNNPVYSGPPGGAAQRPAQNPPTPRGDVAAAALAYRGISTSEGPGKGTVACVWAVNNVLRNAGLQPFTTDNVRTMESQLRGGRGTLVNTAQSMPGDIVVVTSGERAHTGICINTGCSQVISNASGSRSFSWVSDASFSPSYNSGVGRIYRVNN